VPQICQLGKAGHLAKLGAGKEIEIIKGQRASIEQETTFCIKE
jgi:hypothetical protein